MADLEEQMAAAKLDLKKVISLNLQYVHNFTKKKCWGKCYN